MACRLAASWGSGSYVPGSPKPWTVKPDEFFKTRRPGGQRDGKKDILEAPQATKNENGQAAVEKLSYFGELLNIES